MRIIIECPDNAGEDAVVTIKNLQSVAFAQQKMVDGLVTVMVLDHKVVGRTDNYQLAHLPATREEAVRCAVNGIVGVSHHQEPVS